MIAEITEGVQVVVETAYLPEYSDPGSKHFLFSYQINIKNLSKHTIQLLRRQWQIFDSNCTNRIVEGEGVIGLQPIIIPGGCHEYISSCDLKTDIGSMTGYYEMKRMIDGELFRVNIPKFFLISSFRLN